MTARPKHTGFRPTPHGQAERRPAVRIRLASPEPRVRRRGGGVARYRHRVQRNTLRRGGRGPAAATAGACDRPAGGHLHERQRRRPVEHLVLPGITATSQRAIRFSAASPATARCLRRCARAIAPASCSVKSSPATSRGAWRDRGTRAAASAVRRSRWSRTGGGRLLPLLDARVRRRDRRRGTVAAHRQPAVRDRRRARQRCAAAAMPTRSSRRCAGNWCRWRAGSCSSITRRWMRRSARRCIR